MRIPVKSEGDAFRLAYGRESSGEELKDALKFLDSQSEVMKARFAIDKVKPALPTANTVGLDQPRAAAFVDLCHMLLASNEFLYIN